jgi:hypothetical protein
MTIEETTIRKSVAPRRLVVIATVVVVLGGSLGGLAFWMGLLEKKSASDASSERGGGSVAGASVAAAVTLIVSGDTAGWIVPCGCTSNQSGGLPRRGTYVAECRKNGPAIVADAGGAPGGKSPYQRLRFEAILDGEIAMGVAAHNIGRPELSLGLDYLRAVARDKKLPVISANLRDAQHRPIFDACRIVESGGIRVALIGVLEPVNRGEGAVEWSAGDPRKAVLETLASIQGKFDRAVVLAHVNENDLRDLAAALPEVDAVIGGPTGQSLAPLRIGPTLVASATNKGKFLVSLSLPAGNWAAAVTAEVAEMSADFPDDEAQEANVLRFRRDLGRRDFEAFETGFAPEIPAKATAGYRIAGNESCRTCHVAAFGTWHGSGHAQAWETLVAEGTQVDPFCQHCHATGYGLPGGFLSLGKSPDRVAVGCESCHGPALAHVEMPAMRTPFSARDQCVRCHDRENSPRFQYAAYWKSIAHGREMPNGE